MGVTDTASQKKPPKRKKVALGRGLDALIPDIATFDAAAPAVVECDIHLIRPNRTQPRTRFAEEALQELSRSIKSQGIIQPLVVRKSEDGYELIAGERRLRAAKMAGLERVPIVVKNVSDDRLLMLSLVENIQRADLNPIEEAEAYQNLVSTLGLTQAEAAEQVGKSRSAVTNILRLLQLPAEIQASIREGALSEGHARALLALKTPAQQKSLWRKILSQNLSVREAEALTQDLKKPAAQKPAPAPGSDAVYFSDLALELSRHLGTKVDIKRRGKKGRLEIAFYSDEDLDRLIELLRTA